jgi:hypothetical protein
MTPNFLSINIYIFITTSLLRKLYNMDDYFIGRRCRIVASINEVFNEETNLRAMLKEAVEFLGIQEEIESVAFKPLLQKICQLEKKIMEQKQIGASFVKRLNSFDANVRRLLEARETHSSRSARADGSDDEE